MSNLRFEVNNRRGRTSGDSSKNKHAHHHADERGHPIARSIEPGEDWMWCYFDTTVVAPAAAQ